MDTHSYPTFASIREICVEQQVPILVVTDHLQMLSELLLASIASLRCGRMYQKFTENTDMMNQIRPTVFWQKIKAIQQNRTIRRQSESRSLLCRKLRLFNDLRQSFSICQGQGSDWVVTFGQHTTTWCPFFFRARAAVSPAMPAPIITNDRLPNGRSGFVGLLV